jgi:hypothetical protein
MLTKQPIKYSLVELLLVISLYNSID